MSALPDFFLADLPPEAQLTPGMVQAACHSLKRNRAQYLAQRPAESIIKTLTGVGRDWMEPDFPLRKRALAEGPRATGFSAATLARGLDAFFKQLTPANLAALLEQDFGHAERPNRFVATDPELYTDRASLVTGPELAAHITAGNLPVSTLHTMVLGWLCRSAQFLKCATGSSFIPRLFAHSVYAVDPKLGACTELAEWAGGSESLETVLFAETDLVTAMGHDETLETLRRRLPPRVRLAGYGHRVSFAYIASGMLSGLNAAKVARLAASDVAAWDQLGCLSPQVIYVEQGGALSASLFAESLAQELDRMQTVEPRGEIPLDAAAAIASRRSLYELRSAHSADTRLWMSPDSTHWTVVYETEPRFQTSCLHRFIYVKPVSGLEQALQGADDFRRATSTVGIAVPEDKSEEVATRLARWGVSRICPLGKMQEPSLAWRHDGRPALSTFTTWTDWER